MIIVDINLSSDDDIVHPSEPNALADQKVQADNDVEDLGASSVEPNAPDPIRFDVLEKSKPFTADQSLVVPPSCIRG
jgi:hypothetical protein